MYLDFFKLKELPFRLTADPRFYFLGADQEIAKSCVRAAIAEADGCILLSGDSGVGKTILLQDLLSELTEQYAVVQIRHPELSINEFYQAVLAQLDDRMPATVSTVQRASFDTCLARFAASGRSVVIALDNGELIAADLLDEVLRLPRRQRSGARNLRIVMAARPSLERMLQEPQSNSRASHLCLQVKLLPLGESETRLYVEHRLSIAAGNSIALFQQDAFPEIQRYTGGVPRLINTLADAALMLAFNRSRDSVGAADIRAAVDQLRWSEFSSRAEAADPRMSSGRHRQIAAQEDPRGGHIKIEYQGRVIAEFELPIGKVSIGRAMNNDLRIDSQFVSRHHCQILTTAQFSVIEDLQSQNGILVDSRRVSVHRLKAGDRVVLGEHCLTYTRSQRPASSKVALFPMTLSPKTAGGDAGQTKVLKSNPAFTDEPDGHAE